MKNENITILCSGVALGVYIPALIIKRKLEKEGLPVDFHVLENLIFEDKREKILESKFAFHRNFSVALMGQRMAQDISPNFDPALIAQLVRHWEEKKSRRFIVFSGYWIPVLKEYMQTVEKESVTAELCHMDAVLSTSFKPYKNDFSLFKHTRFYDWEKKSVPVRLQISRSAPLPYAKRENRFVIHGGGWGMGTYKDKISVLEAMEIGLDIINYEERDIRLAQSNRNFMIDPAWKAWEKDRTGDYSFPPFAKYSPGKEPAYSSCPDYPDVYHLINWAKGIISKPGGSTLTDSLSSATPLIYLEPFGEYEKFNGKLWEELGFGISLEKWLQENDRLAVLEKLHSNILQARANIEEFTEQLINKNN